MTYQQLSLLALATIPLCLNFPSFENDVRVFVWFFLDFYYFVFIWYVFLKFFN